MLLKQNASAAFLLLGSKNLLRLIDISTSVADPCLLCIGETIVQTNVNLDRRGLDELVAGIFEAGNPEVYLSDTVGGENAGPVTSAQDVIARIDAAVKANKKLVAFTIWYPDTGGHVEERRAGRDRTKSKWHLNRHAISGWGIILLQLNFENSPLINCCVSCSSRKKAQTWSGSHPDLKNPDLWDWKVVERYCGHLVRLADRLERKLVQPGVPPEI